MTIGLDVGGANVKAAALDRRGGVRWASRRHELWRDRDGVRAAIRRVLLEVAGGGAAPVALTTTAELSDAFRTKREGVLFVLDVVEAAIGARPLRVLTNAGALLAPDAARSRPLDVAAANWVATATVIAADHPDAILVDVGSTTTDVIALIDGRVAALGRTDLDRLLHGELVYTGALRTNAATIAARVPVRGRDCSVASELFAISADVHLLLGHLGPDATDCSFPDGRPATVAAARERLARLVCSDVEQLGADEIDAIARHLHDAQVAAVAAAVDRAAARFPTRPPVVAVGLGAFLAREAAAQAGCPLAELSGPWRDGGAEVAPAVALALLGGRDG